MVFLPGIAAWFFVSFGAAYWACRRVDGRRAVHEGDARMVTGKTTDVIRPECEKAHEAGRGAGDEGAAKVVSAVQRDGAKDTERQGVLLPDAGASDEQATAISGNGEGAAKEEPAVAVSDIETPPSIADTADSEEGCEKTCNVQGSSEVTAGRVDERPAVTSADRGEHATVPVGHPRTWGAVTWGAALTCLAITTVLAYLASANTFDWRGYACALLCYAAVLAAAITDAKSRLIFNEIPLAIIGIRCLTLVYEFATQSDYASADLRGSLFGFGACFLVFVVVRIFARGGIGGGDIKLIGAVGFVGGLYLAIYSLLFSLLLCSVVAIALMIFKQRSRKDSLPFAPFLYVGVSTALMLLLA